MINEYRDAYKKLNGLDKKSELIYPLSNRGLFSELNNLVLAVLFCLENNIRLKLYSEKWISGKWEDYFIPLFEEYKGIIPIPVYIYSKGRKDFFYRIYHIYLKNRIILQDGIWNEMRSNSFIEKHFFYPELGINGNVFQAKRQLFNIILDYNNETAKEIFSLKDTELDFVKKSCGIHVRRGDKVNGNSKESELFNIESYINKAQENDSDIRQFTICTDDRKVLENFKNKYPKYDYFSLCPPNRLGYFQYEFNIITNYEEKRKEVINILKDANLLITSKMFIGTYSSNISRFIVLMRNNENCHSLDTNWSPL
jgi:hypothetical protein